MKRSSLAFLFFLSCIVVQSQSTFIKKYNGTPSGINAFYFDLETTPDSGFIVSGTNIFLSTSQKGLLIRFDKDGNTSWAKANSGGPGYEILYSVDESIIGNYLAAGLSTSNNLYSNMSLHEFSPSGSLLWSRDVTTTYGGLGDYTMINQAPNGDIVVCATAYDSIAGGIVLTRLYSLLEFISCNYLKRTT